ncbi:MAG: glycosyltransferase involved in cell wall biosynthesis, partial [Planctomycetota bacterium]
MHINHTNPTISIILCAYNMADSIANAIKSVLKQTYVDWELIIVDDGSTDLLKNVLSTFLDDSRVKYIYHTNRKLSLSRNTGILLARGTYITFIDADDMYAPEHLQSRIDYMQKNAHIDMIHSPVHIIGSTEDQFVVDKEDPSSLIHVNNCTIGGTFFGKQHVFTSTGFDPKQSWGIDYDLCKRIGIKHIVKRFDLPTY